MKIDEDIIDVINILNVYNYKTYFSCSSHAFEGKNKGYIFFEYNEELLKYCYLNNLNYFVQINSVKEGLYANSLNAKYIVCKKTLAKKMQKIAENYMFDSKILAIIKSNDQLIPYIERTQNEIEELIKNRENK